MTKDKIINVIEEAATVASETVAAVVDIPIGALDIQVNISVGDVTEELPEEIDNATGVEVEE